MDAIFYHVVKSFLELIPIILSIPGVSFFLSDKLNQDPLENFFGCVRQHGGVNNNPTVAEAMKSTQTLRVISSLRADRTIRGNCRGRATKFSFEDSDIDQNRRICYCVAFILQFMITTLTM